MLDVLNLCGRRGERTLFDKLAFHLESGESLHVHGLNGSGKTTLLRLLCALVPPSAGEIRWNGVSAAQMGREYHSQVLYLGHRNAIKEELTPLENLEFFFQAGGASFDRGDALKALKRLGISDAKSLPCRFLSEGQKRRVALARLVFPGRPLWILDEPCAALDTEAAREVFSLIGAHLRRGGIAVLASPRDDVSGILADHELWLGHPC